MDVLTLRALLTLDKSQYDKGIDEANSKSDSFGSKFAGKMKKAAKAGAVALGAFAVSSVKVGADFDKSMSQVAATMGYTVEELNTAGSQAQKDYQALEKTARELGKSTAFSAQEAAEGLNYMALAGYDVETSQRMLPQVLNLAAAGAMDLASASDMVTDAQSALGLSVENTEHMVDQMAKTASLTNTNVAQLGSAFLTVGGTAKMMKSDTESAEHATAEMSAALGTLASAGIKGSEGGTALRNILQGITGSKFDKTFKQLGVAAYDASGQLRDLPDILGDMNKAMEGMTTEEKNDIITKTFNVRDLKSVNALLAQTPEKWDELTRSIMDSDGAAQNMAETQLDNLAGDVTILKSAFSELQIAVSDLDHGALRSLVQGLTNVVNVFADLAQADSFATFKDILSNAFQSAGDGMNAFLEKMQTALPKVAEGFTSMIPSIMNGLANASQNIRSFAGKFADVGLAFIKSIAQGLIKNIPVFIQTVPVIITNFAGIINDNAPKIIATGVSILKSLVAGIIKAIPVLIASIPSIIKAIASVLTAFGWAGIGKKVISGVAKGIKSGASAIKSAVLKPVNQAKAAIVAGFTAARDKAKSAMESLKNSVKSKIDAAKTAVKSAVDKIKGFFPLHVGKIFTGIKLPHFSVSGSPPFGLGGKGEKPSIHVSWYKKAEENPYLFSNATLFGAGEGTQDEMLYGKKALMDDIKEATSGIGTVINNYITVDGAENPEDFARRFVRQMKMEVRMA